MPTPPRAYEPDLLLAGGPDRRDPVPEQVACRRSAQRVVIQAIDVQNLGIVQMNEVVGGRALVGGIVMLREQFFDQFIPFALFRQHLPALEHLVAVQRKQGGEAPDKQCRIAQEMGIVLHQQLHARSSRCVDHQAIRGTHFL